ncbi:RecQ family ATP-dependent DNA helicase [Salinicola rhizosphaerae]|uniref:ATP-dependent DNA helicase RecQ n=1 Tax=Salinicola rhizosphaerae TaxID=1443141 RepID=A0ABQ3E2X7_9GAMM|nr:RecQ family ATP-dependent DNA helicase [Salinicola rhizosphaerae]GHB24622.1 ATP-dependent DNA helicase RecQ [Salinicola rhizosphaerae]
MSSLDTARHTLQTVFGFDDFRGGQADVVERVITGRSTAAIFATGAGKSLCYQLPALALPNLTLVVSPLLALMQDQLAFLERHGVAAASLDSTQDRDTSREIMDQARRGELKILMVSVERLKNERFRHFLQRIDISLLVIDEAHCISEWGHNFRPDYLKLPDYQREFGIPQALLLTATATPAVIADMREKFAIAESDVITTGFYRPNLELLVEPVPAAARTDRLIDWLGPQQQPGQEVPTIVYVTLQQTAETVAGALAARGFNVRAYHAGLDSDTRDAIQQGFMRGEIPCIVATIAFGMGIDKGDIRNVVHFDLPKSIENYSQEIGRAGRDGKPSRCLTLAGRDGLRVLENFVYGDTPEREGIRHVLTEIVAAGQTPERQWPVLLNTLSRESNVRLLPLKTLLVRLEMLGVIAPRFAFLAEYRLRYLEPPDALIARFDGERADFVRLIVDNVPVARTWGTVDFERLYQAGAAAEIDASRSRVITALEYFQEKGWLVLEGKRMTDVFEVIAPEIDIDALSEQLVGEGEAREAAEIGRLHAMVDLFESTTCLTYRLAAYFGDDIADESGRDSVQTAQSRSHATRGCGHCSVCHGLVAKLPPAPSLPPLTEEAFRRDAGPLIARHREQFGHSPGARRVAHFLCGLPMPLFTPLKARQLKAFGQYEHYPYPDIRAWAEASMTATIEPS